MMIGIDGSRAFLKNRTGIEEYSYQVIRHLRDELGNQSVRLYVRKKLCVQNRRLRFVIPEIDFELPSNWEVRGLSAPRFWTQGRLSLELLFRPVDVLFVPAHTVPWIHPERTIVTIHGLEYEFSPESYSWYERLYMRFSIRNSVRWASRIISVSENTKRDLVRLYGVPEEKISVIYEGISSEKQENLEFRISNLGQNSRFKIPASKFFLFIGRIETRKNVARIIEAFERFKERTGLSHELILAGKPGYGYEKIKQQISNSKYQNEIQELGYITEEDKWQLLKEAEALLFPSLYEGFGLPILEAQQVGTPVITSNTSSLPEIAGEGALLVDPENSQALAEAMEEIVSDPELRAGIIEKATHNVSRFSWTRCAKAVAACFSVATEA